MADKQSKQAAGYMHFDGTEYHCSDCYKWFTNEVCLEVQGVIRANGGCNTFVQGNPDSSEGDCERKLTQLEAGYVENKVGFSCKRCEYFGRQNWDCKIVDKDSPGVDKGVIHPNACCNNWSKDRVFGVIA